MNSVSLSIACLDCLDLAGYRVRDMRHLQGIGVLIGVLTGYAVVLNAPVVALTFLFRRRLSPNSLRVIISVGFAAASAFMLWKFEWFDVWRHGIPPLTYLLLNYIPVVAVTAVIGWCIGSAMRHVAYR